MAATMAVEMVEKMVLRLVAERGGLRAGVLVVL
jgi:hypothetical protein